MLGYDPQNAFLPGRNTKKILWQNKNAAKLRINVIDLDVNNRYL
jgi:hypothetical protein